MVATHSLHQPRFPLLSKESLVVIKTKVIMGSLKFFCKTHQVSDCGGIDYGYLRHPMVALKVFCKDLWDKHDSSVERSSLPGRSILKKKVGKSSQIVDYLHFNGALLGTASAAENCSFPEISSEDNCIRLWGEVAMMLCSPRTETA